MTRPDVTIDAELLLNHLEAIERAVNDIRSMAAQGIDQPASPAGININVIDWRDRNSDIVGPDAKWAWAFTYNENGILQDETRQLVEEIGRYGKVEVSGYEITLSGRDGKLLNRKKLK